jgi:hypothetical protein
VSTQRDKRVPAIDGALGLITVIVVVQIWLLTATLESWLAGHRGAALAGAVVSAALFSACGALYLFISRVDRRSRGTAGPPSERALVEAGGTAAAERVKAE